MIRKPKLRSARGSYQLNEFGAAVFLLFSVVVVPLIDFSVIPVRFALGKTIVNHKVHQLAQCETLSEAFKLLKQSEFETGLRKIGGFDANLVELSLHVSSIKNPDQFVAVSRPGALSSEWLPGGTRTPCLYRLTLKVDAKIEPLITARMPGISVPGLTDPIPFLLREECAWENLGCDPSTGEYFINK